TLSIEVLPAPFGPMMARTSPLRISKEMLVRAFKPPKEREMFFTSRRTSLTAGSRVLSGEDEAVGSAVASAFIPLPPCAPPSQPGRSARRRWSDRHPAVPFAHPRRSPRPRHERGYYRRRVHQ